MPARRYNYLISSTISLLLFIALFQNSYAASSSGIENNEARTAVNKLMKMRPSIIPLFEEDLGNQNIEKFAKEKFPRWEYYLYENKLTVTVENIHAYDLKNHPVSNGISIPRDLEITDVDDLALYNDRGEKVSAQFLPLAWWEDGERIKWVLVSFQDYFKANDSSVYSLNFRSGAESTGETLIAEEEQGIVNINTGKIKFTLGGENAVASGIELLINGQWVALDENIRSAIKLPDARVATPGQAGEIEIEDNGQERAQVMLSGPYLEDGSATGFVYVMRVQAYRNSRDLRIEHTLVNEREGQGQEIIDLSFMLPVVDGEYEIATEESVLQSASKPDGDNIFGLLQDDENHYRIGMLNKESGKEDKAGRFSGWLTAKPEADWGVSVAIRDFWQKYPKSLEVTDEGIKIGLLPEVSENRDSFKPAGQHVDNYRFTHAQGYYAGESRTHELIFHFHQQAKEQDEIAGVFVAFNQPLFALASPQWYCFSKGFGDLVPWGSNSIPGFEQAAKTSLDNLLYRREHRRLYGDRNYGDDEYINPGRWNNQEYDYPHVGMLNFIRGAGRDWYDKYARPGARNMMDLAIINAGPRKGLVYYHDAPGDVGTDTLGHTSSANPRLLSHSWAQGLFNYYAFSGDFRARDAALSMVDRWSEDILRRTRRFRETGDMEDARIYGHGRMWGWTLMSLMGAYQTIPDNKYLESAKALIDSAIVLNQDGVAIDSFPLGGDVHIRGDGSEQWVVPSRILPVWDAVIRYYQTTGDQEVKEFIVETGKVVSEKAWIDPPGAWAYNLQRQDFRAASNHNTAPLVGYAYLFSNQYDENKVMWERAVQGFKKAARASFSDGKNMAWSLSFAVRMPYLIEKIEALK